MDNYYELVMGYQSSSNDDRNASLKELKSVIQELIDKGYMSYNVTIDGDVEKQLLIYEHVDPIEGKAIDMRAICMDNDETIHWGNIIEREDGRTFMAITRNDWNEAYNKYKVRECFDDYKLSLDQYYTYKCIMATKGFYDETSYINSTTVFDDKDLRAVLIQYNNDTKSLTMFDDIYINDEHFKVVKIDNYTFKQYDEDYGVMQLVVIDTPFGDIVKNDTGLPIKGIVMTARVKDKILNSISRELICNHNQVKRGDYIDFTYDRDKKGTMKEDTYIIINNPTMNEGYDISLMYLCENSIKLLNDVGEVVNIPFYYEDNRVRIDKSTENEYVRLANSSYQIILQNNPLTQKLGKNNKVKRVMINGKAYAVTGEDDNTTGLISIGLEIDQVIDGEDVNGVANYASQMKEISGGNADTMIYEVNGEEYLYKGFANTYKLKDVSSGITWSTDVTWCTVTQNSDGGCNVKFNDLKYANETVILSALYGSMTYTFEIKTKS